MIADEEDIEAFADDVREMLGDRVRDVFLYGSYARDEHVPGSDIDIAVIVSEKENGDRKRVQGIAEKYFMEKGLRFSPRVFEQGEFDRKVEEGYSYYVNVAGQGVRV